jgi:hypothetical protein
LEWSYLEGRDSYRSHRALQEVITAGCWMKGTLAELRQLQEGKAPGVLHIASGKELVLRSGETAYVARCGIVVVEVRNQTVCTQEIPLTFRGEEVYVEHLSLALQSSATLVSCRREAPP